MSSTSSDIRETTYLIHDLCCATEEQLIRKRLQGRAGIQDLDFNIISHKLRVRHSCSEEVITRNLKEIGLPGINEAQAAAAIGKSHRRLLLSTGLSGLLFLGGLAAEMSSISASVSILFFVSSLISGGWHIALKAYKAVRTRSLEMNALMTIASVGAIVLGQYAEGAAVVFLFSVSLLIESFSVDRTRRAIRSLMGISPTKATVVRAGIETVVPVEEIDVGESVLIRPGERIPTDAKVVEGHSSVDEAPITGESTPVLKRKGDRVYAGSFNQLGALELIVLKRVNDSTIARIIHLVEDAQSKKAPSQTLVERFARYYTPSIFGMAVALATLPPLLFGQPFGVWIYRSLVLLVIACPCALVISTPVTLVSALTNAARHGILIKGGKHLEALAQVRALAFDKTGTLTEGRLTVTDIVPLNSLSTREILRIAAAAEVKSEHHLAEALLRKAKDEGIGLSEFSIEDFSSITGKGIRTRIDGKSYIVGNHQLVEEMGICSEAVEKTLHRLESEGKTVVILTNEEEPLGVIAVSDRIRNESTTVIEALHKLGVEHVVMLTGDNRGTALAVAGELKVDNLRAELLPEDKLSIVRELKARYGIVAMVGDGINDAPALAAADIGIAMGGAGSDTALETADIALMTDNISKIPYGISLGQRALRVVRQNIALALLTKSVFLMLGIFGLSSLWLAILADDGAALLVILNGLRLLGKSDQ
jgi:Zn2+/Cd2+-exporting ATPase